MNPDSTRRSILAGMLASLAPLSGAAETLLLCLGDPAIFNRQSPLTIDTHTHIFNGSDLQIREFLSQTTVGADSEIYPLVSAMSGVLQAIAWHKAPSAAEERSAISKYASRLQQCSGGDQLRTIAKGTLQDGYALGKIELQRAANSLPQTSSNTAVLGPKEGKAGLGAAIDGLPPTLEEFEGDNAPTVLATQPSVAGYIRFVMHHFNYRHANAIDFLSTYSSNQSRKIDLTVASMVDYDYWLARGKATATSLTDQVELMSEISVLLGGRVHGFVPFCPFRETMTLDAAGVGNSMRLVKNAIENHGFIGVKIYPPMGFAALGNTGRSEWVNKKSIDPVSWQPGFGERLDKAMSSLFRYCQENDVPIMAHSNDSNGPYENFRKLAGSGYWKLALEKFPGLSVNFGHFGDSDPDDHRGKDTLPFLRLMSSTPGSIGVNTFADSGFFAGTMVNQGKMRDTLVALYNAENGIMRDRLMYGSDWSMLLTQESSKNYLKNFIQLMARIEGVAPNAPPRPTTLTNAFFGLNAAEFLGLKANRGNRKRLELFYSRFSVPQPDWLSKVG